MQKAGPRLGNRPRAKGNLAGFPRQTSIVSRISYSEFRAPSWTRTGDWLVNSPDYQCFAKAVLTTGRNRVLRASACWRFLLFDRNILEAPAFTPWNAVEGRRFQKRNADQISTPRGPTETCVSGAWRLPRIAREAVLKRLVAARRWSASLPGEFESAARGCISRPLRRSTLSVAAARAVIDALALGNPRRPG